MPQLAKLNYESGNRIKGNMHKLSFLNPKSSPTQLSQRELSKKSLQLRAILVRIIFLPILWYKLCYWRNVLFCEERLYEDKLSEEKPWEHEWMNQEEKQLKETLWMLKLILFEEIFMLLNR